MKSGNTFGIEIEFSSHPQYDIGDLFIQYCEKERIPCGAYGWHYKHDSSVTHDETINGKKVLMGGEMNSAIINNYKSIEDMKKAMEFFDIMEMESDDRCAGHLHTGAHIVKRDIEVYKNLLLFWMTYEREFFMLTNEGNEHVRYNMAKHSQPLFLALHDRIDNILAFDGSIKDFIDTFQPEKGRGLNLRGIAESQKYTFEIRLIKATTDGNLWETYIDLAEKTFEYVGGMNQNDRNETVLKLRQMNADGLANNDEMTPDNVRRYYQSSTLESTKDFLGKVNMEENRFKFLGCEHK